ncbi:MAG: hypothetical protein FJX21_10435 [Alphaproteobacteria bacterium]|nr:hypothetical protein [Alphaproteobacteria bacterium]
MFSDARRHLVYRVANAPVFNYPFPHVLVHEVFPPSFYARIQEMLPESGEYIPLRDTGRVGSGYSPRRLALFPDRMAEGSIEPARAEFWRSVFDLMKEPEFGHWIMAKFYDVIAPRLGIGTDSPGIQLSSESFLMRDLDSYSLGPHTDSPSKVVSVLIYLPSSSERADLGTSIYAPLDRSFTCPGGPHHPFAKFERIVSMPYVPNTLFAFPKTDRCFHGVEHVEGVDARRDILFFDLRLAH